MKTIKDTGFIPPTLHVVKKYIFCPLDQSCTRMNTGSVSKAHTPTDDVTIIQIPVVGAHSTPGSIVEHLNPTFQIGSAPSKSYIYNNVNVYILGNYIWCHFLCIVLTQISPISSRFLIFFILFDRPIVNIKQSCNNVLSLCFMYVVYSKYIICITFLWTWDYILAHDFIFILIITFCHSSIHASFFPC